jgi:serine/threonine protein kinase
MSGTRNTDPPVTPNEETQVGSHPVGGPATPAFPFLRPPDAPGEIGRLGGYRVFKLIGSGGMGKVFLAEDLALKRDVALKVMCPPPGEDLLSWRERFLREARALAAIKHPNLVTVYQVGEDRGTVFLALELLEGETLEARVRREAPLALTEVLRLGEQVAIGLAAIHNRGLIHRDIKPGNIWLCASPPRDTEPVNVGEVHSGVGEVASEPDPQIKILDFGLVREAKGDTQLTEAGAVVGTPAYMSLEQVRGDPLDHRTDLFSFGCVLYAMCTGRPPFDANNPMAQAAALAADDPVPARERNPAVPVALSELLADLLARKPDARPASAAVVIERLRAVAAGRTGSDSEPVHRPFYRRHALKLGVTVWLVFILLWAVVLPRGSKQPADERAARESLKDGTYLSDLPKQAELVFPPPGAPLPPGVDGSVTVGGVRSPHGLYMHGAQESDEPPFVQYSLDGKFSWFTAEVAINDTGRKGCRVGFHVIADGRELWHSGNLTQGDQPEKCDVDVRNVRTLTLEVRTYGPEAGAHGAWIEPRVTK